MTLHGTNSYILGEGRVAVIDPGPDDPAHLAAIESALGPGERISNILVTHSHRDHSPLARALSYRSGAAVMAFGASDAGRSQVMQALADDAGLGGGEGRDVDFRPDVLLADGAEVEGQGWRIRGLWTPGHMGNHMCFQWNDIVFTGDHVMGWASTMVSPPDGDMGHYMRSLDRLAACKAHCLLPGHGDPVRDPAGRIAELARHRRMREAQILAGLGREAVDLDALTAAVYTDTPAALMRAARRNVLAHLIDLADRGAVRVVGKLGPGAGFMAA